MKKMIAKICQRFWKRLGDSVFAFMIVGAGSLTSITLYTLLLGQTTPETTVNWLPVFNYQLFDKYSILDLSIESCIPAFFLAASVVSVLIWMLSKEGKTLRPNLVTIASLVGCLVGFFLYPVTFGQVENLIRSTGLHIFVTFFSGVAFARFAMNFKKEKSRKNLAANVTGCIALVLIYAVITISGLPWSSFPVDDKPPAERAAWANEQFGPNWQNTHEYLKDDGGLTTAVGEVKSIAPIAGLNRTFLSEDGAYGIFTVNVIGDTGSALAKVSFVRRYNVGWNFSGKFTHNSQEKALETKEFLEPTETPNLSN